VRVLEIGAQFGNSLLAWEKYFRDPACIVGIAYGQRSADPKEMTKGKVSFLRCGFWLFDFESVFFED
jgi:hypothetical protein